MFKRLGMPLLAIALSTALGLAACGGGSPQQDATPPEGDAQQQEQPAEAPEASEEPEPADDAEEPAEPEPVELDSDAILDAVISECPISLAMATDIKVSAVHDGVRTVTFGSTYGDFSYTVDAYTGEILEKVEPEISEPAESSSSGDPIEQAINACLNAAGCTGGAENIKVSVGSEDGVQMIEVTFDWNGQSYDMLYNSETGEITQQ